MTTLENPPKPWHWR